MRLKIQHLLFIGFFIVLFFPNQSFAQSKADERFEKQYQERIIKEKINGVYIPKDLGDVFKQLNRLIDKKSQIKLKNASETAAVRNLHFSFGRWMIKNWGFYEGSRLSAYLKSLGVHNPDDMADFLILCYHRNLNRNPLNVKEQVTQIQERRKRIREKRIRKGKVIKEFTRKVEKKKG